MTEKTMKWTKRGVLVAALLGASGTFYGTQAYPQFLGKAQDLGYPAKDCTYCHTKASGGAGWNARGTWLKAEKKKRHADQIDVEWLKDYKGK
jgi:hypothetical protein